jgi:drug/metabolite transporter (DMT)-like permease
MVECDVPARFGEVMAVTCGLAWAVSVVLFRRVGDTDPRALNLFKNVVASLLLLITLAVMGQGFDLHRSTEDWTRLLGSSLLGLTVGDTLFFAGLQRIGASVAAVTDCTYSPVVLLFSVLLLGEALSPGLLVGLPLVVVGLLVVAWRSEPKDKSGTSTEVGKPVDRLGVLFAMGGVACSALGAVLAKPALERSGLVEATAVRMVFSSLTLLLWQVASGRTRSSWQLFLPHPRWRWMLPATVMGSYFSMLLWLGGFKYAPASTAALLNQLATIFLLVLSATLGGEVVPARRWAGAAIAFSGAMVVLAGSHGLSWNPL